MLVVNHYAVMHCFSDRHCCSVECESLHAVQYLVDSGLNRKMCCPRCIFLINPHRKMWAQLQLADIKPYTKIPQRISPCLSGMLLSHPQAAAAIIAIPLSPIDKITNSVKIILMPLWEALQMADYTFSILDFPRLSGTWFRMKIMLVASFFGRVACPKLHRAW